MTNRALPLLVANWKANLPPGEEVALAGAIANEARRRGLLPGTLMIAPSSLGLVPVASLLQREHASLQIGVAAQDASELEPGAHTGETPVTHLLGIAGAVILGHSERRNLGETGAQIGRKIARTVAVGLRPIICVGDTAREATTEQRYAEVRAQWDELMGSATKSGCSLTALLEAGALVAYEPVWAIGSGASADPELAGGMAAAIREGSSDHVQILYGGSVRASHAAPFFAGAGPSRMDGLLVGGASLSSESLLDIAAALGSAS
jgi:triosephosphate isomerase (TIM)